MTSPKDLEVALLDFINVCTTNEDSCDDCMYREFCIRFYTPHCDSPNEWEILEKSGGIPC